MGVIYGVVRAVVSAEVPDGASGEEKAQALVDAAESGSVEAATDPVEVMERGD